MAVALVLHVLAAFLLCWAARPIDQPPATEAKFAIYHIRKDAQDTFKNYRRGWRLTIFALVASSAAVLVFLLQEFGIELPLKR